MAKALGQRVGRCRGQSRKVSSVRVLSSSLQLSPALAMQGALPGATGPLSRCLVGEQDSQLGGLSSQPEGGPPAPYTHQRR